MTLSPRTFGGVSLAAIGVLFVVFTAGIVAGFTGGFLVGREVPPPPPGIAIPAGMPAPVMVAPMGMLPDLFDAIGATREQRAAIDRIVGRRRLQTEAILDRSFPALRAIADSTDREIRAVLTPQQRARLDELRVNDHLRVAPLPAPDPFGPGVLPRRVPVPAPGPNGTVVPMTPPTPNT